MSLPFVFTEIKFRDATTGFPREMKSEKRAQKFHTDDVSVPRSD